MSTAVAFGCETASETASWNMLEDHNLPSGKRLHNYGTSPFSMGKSTRIPIFQSYVKLPEGII